MSKFFARISVAIALSLGSLGFAGTASACCYKQVTCYETVICYETRTVPYTKLVLRYDECGRPYSAEVTCYETVRVPIKKVVAVTKLVKVCD